jgi:hypothetical protein
LLEEEVVVQGVNLYWPAMEPTLLESEKKVVSLCVFSNFLLARHNSISASPYNGYFCVLPQELVFYILSFLNGDDLAQCCTINKDFHRIAGDDQLYRILCERQGYLIKKPETKTWKWVYKCHQVRDFF